MPAYKQVNPIKKILSKPRVSLPRMNLVEKPYKYKPLKAFKLPKF